MKLTSLFICVFSLQLSASVFSQDANVKFGNSQNTVSSIIDAIEEQTQFKIFYKTGQFDTQKNVRLSSRSLSVADALGEVFAGTNISYKVMDKVIVLATVKDIKAAMAFPVSGVVTGPDGSPIPGVSVLEKGTSNGTITDMDGKYTLNASSGDAVLVFSFLGMETQEVAIAGSNTVNAQMKDKNENLDEVVVVGYGVQKKKLNTGATTNVKGDDIEKLSTTNALQAMQGQTAGVNITSTSGQPGEGMKVVIRGIGTNGNSTPLYIVDGIQTSDISYLNSADIESIDILKDAASAAIYGSRGANGVVLVTTKQGKKGKGVISFDGYMGFQNVANKAEVLNVKEYATIMNEQAVNSGKSPYFTDTQIASMTGTNWMDEMFVSNAKVQNYALGMTGGNDVSTYSTSLSYNSQEGIVGGKDYSFFERFGFRFNSEHKLIKDVLKLGQHLTVASTNRNGIQVGDQYSNTLRTAFNADPFIPMYDSNGNYWDNTSTSNWNNGIANPYAAMVYKNQNKTSEYKLLGDFYAELTPIKNLHIRSVLGTDFNLKTYHNFLPIYQISLYDFNKRTKVNQYSNKDYSITWTNTATYSFNIADNHFDAMVGTEAIKSVGDALNATNVDLSLYGLKYAYVVNTTNNSDAAFMNITGNAYDDMRISYFGRLGYNYKERYMLSATMRADGTSKFAPGHNWGYFPSVSAGWTISNESFFQSLTPIVSSLKLRTSWGQNGNDNFDSHIYDYTVSFLNAGYNFGDKEGTSTAGAFTDRLGNSKLKWETSEQTNVGLDATFLKDRLTFSIDYYNKKTKDWVIKSPILATAGTGAPYINGGNISNKGLELLLSWRDKIGDFTYSVSGNLSKNKNEVTEIPNADGTIHGSTNLLWNNSPEFYRAQTGYPISYFWGFKTAGVFQNEQEVLDYKNSQGVVIQPTAKPGDLKYVDLDGDGVITTADKTNIGDPNPDYTFGFNISAEYKGFDLSITANGVAGNQIVQSYRNNTDPKANYFKSILGRWHGEGTSNKLPRLTEDGKNYIEFSDIFVQDGDFLRISNITLGYDLSKFIHVKFISKLRIYVSAQNAFTFTKYDGMDPEVGYGSDFSYGVDNGFYPRPRTILFGCNLKF